MISRFSSARNGFTLIELLIVIGVIGILASIILSSLQTARTKGVDGKIKGEIGQTRTQASLYYDNSGGLYTDICSVTGGLNNISDIRLSLEIQSDAVTCADSDAAWAIEAQLKTTAEYYCADSSGEARIIAASSIADGSDYVCGP